MKLAAQQRLIIGLIGVSVLGIWGYRQAVATFGSVTREIDGTVDSLNPETGEAVLEFAHPKTGEIIRLAGRVAPDCEITINGAPAKLADLRIGDAVRVRGSISASKRVTPHWVQVTRPPATAQSAPNTDGATQP